jgi:hypothetical protein
VRKLKEEDGGDLMVLGSGELAQTLMANGPDRRLRPLGRSNRARDGKAPVPQGHPEGRTGTGWEHDEQHRRLEGHVPPREGISTSPPASHPGCPLVVKRAYRRRMGRSKASRDHVRQNAAMARSRLAQAGDRCLHRLVGREENRDLAAGQLRSELCARLTEEFAGDGARRKDCLR